MGDGVYMEAPGADRLNHVRAQHQVTYIGLGNQHPLLTAQAVLHAYVEKAFDFLIDSTNGLDLAPLIHRASDSQILPQRQIAQTGEQGVQLGGGGAITINAAIDCSKHKLAESVS